MDKDFLQTASLKLAEADPILGRLIKNQALQPSQPRRDYFAALCRSIVGQQVSVPAANAIFGRFESQTRLVPSKVAKLSEAECKLIGLSKQKSGYLKDLAAHFVDNPVIYDHLDKQPDDQVITELTAVKGIGVWTAQMFLMFTLARPDVFAPDDVGLQNAMIKLYGWDKLPPKKDLQTIADKWQPYRTVACLHLWLSLHNDPNLN